MRKRWIGMLAAMVAVLTPMASVALEVGDAIPGRYLVVMEPDSKESTRGLLGGSALGGLIESAREVVDAIGGETLHAFGPALPGYLARLTPEQAEQLRRKDGVRRVEPDRVVARTRRPASWGLDRIDQRELPLDRRFEAPARGGEGVSVYIIDTGLRASHSDFRDRVGGGANFAGSGPGPGLIEQLVELLHPGNVERDDWGDCNGHGTHVAGSAVGAQHGVARGATVFGVRVLGCDGTGSTSGVIAGIDWVMEHHEAPAVANLSLGGAASASMDEAVQRLVAAGVTTVAAAGNDNADACDGSPARVAEVVTVGASTREDHRAEFSNWGSCVELFAPGEGISSAWHESDGQTRTLNGTSMAAPHVAGALALLLAETPGMDPEEAGQRLISDATEGVLQGLRRGSPNRLLYISKLSPERRPDADALTPPAEPRRQRGGLLDGLGL